MRLLMSNVLVKILFALKQQITDCSLLILYHGAALADSACHVVKVNGPAGLD